MTDMPKVTSPDFARLGQAVTDAMCDSMLERVATTAANGMEVLDKLNDPDVKDGVATLLDTIGTLHRTGAMQTVIDTVFLLHALRSSANDSMIERIFSFVEHMWNNLGTEELATLAHEAKGAMEDALDNCNIPGGGRGFLGTMKMLSKPETQEALRFMLAFSCGLKKRASVLQKAPTS